MPVRAISGLAKRRLSAALRKCRMESYRRALTLSPDYTLAHYRLGQAHMKLKQPDQAVDSFREVLRLAPDSDLGRSVAEYIKILK